MAKIVSDPKLYILLVALTLSLAVLVVTLYHCIIICCCNRNPPRRQIQHRLRPNMQGITSFIAASSVEASSVAQLIPAHKFQKGVGLVLVGDGMCAVCLTEIEEGEEFRTLPECMHSFHVPCIDKWLYSHPSCPICRTDATPRKPAVKRSPDYGSGGLERPQESIILQDIVVMQSS
ncbi:PREDICTED: RING-H2 finger [Prunus dulcis]|uniref:PREDICTED: RING-H2 finger n=1 Tax=Prunus dulcis TaxID=3755 RepID=A0A5E4EAI8_PRUDU|nr:RING-H2 finger protein ATL52-like [Prunus dulcis]KAI5346380.1 hypothetical protein L3X38_014259 [Prunus dulcis]VVA12452.1 PREDICTED: RING-H2 finger [Prunus dulcis]